MRIDGQFINSIKNEYGLPCYVFDEEEFIGNYKRFESALKKYYSEYRVALSYKTNYTPKICSIVKDFGGYAEVVSDMEYSIAKKIGYDNRKIIYNGPYKGEKAAEHLLSGGILNVDNLDELDRIIELATKKRKKIKIGIRVNIDIGQSFVSRFGIDADSDDLNDAVKMIKNCEYVELVGFHCHIGRSRGLEAWKNRTLKMIALADKYIDGIPEYINLGSGMFGDVEPELADQFSCYIPTYEEYAEVTSKLFGEHYRKCIRKPILFTEPGTTLDNRYVKFIAEVDSIKRIKDKYFAALNCSMYNIGDVGKSIKIPMKVVSRSKVKNLFDRIDLVGYTCLERDVVYREYSGELGVGDYVVFGNVGGYSTVFKPPFILPQCAFIGVNRNGVYPIKKKETVADILSTYVLE